MQKGNTTPTCLKQSSSMICGILLDATFFVHNNKTIKPEEIGEYVNIVNSYIHVLREVHDGSIIFAIVYAGKSVVVNEFKQGDLVAPMIETIKNVLNQKFIPNEPNLSSAMSLALSILNKEGKIRPQIQKKLIMISSPFEYSSKFIPLMNCIFAAQKVKATIDSIVLNDSERNCTFCQQASYLTNGIYNTATLESLLPRLLSNNILDCNCEGLIRVTGNDQTSIDWRLWCFHCRKPLDHGYVCSSCFSIYCEEQKGVCPTCGSHFE